MARNWAIAVGLNQYLQMHPLKYAQQDAAGVRAFLSEEAKFDQVYYFGDDSTDVIFDGVTIPTQPTYTNLKQFLDVRFATPFLQPEDTLWFFFHGHGLHYANQDYLMLSDSEPDNADQTAVSIEWVTETLRRCGSQNIILVLDACHTEEQKFGQGFGTDPQGVITLFSADFHETANEVEGLQQGLFTHVLLDGLRFYGKHNSATLFHLHKYVHDRLPKISRHLHLPNQTPRLHNSTGRSWEDIPLPRTGKATPLQSNLWVRVAAVVALCLVGGGYWLSQEVARAPAVAETAATAGVNSAASGTAPAPAKGTKSNAINQEQSLKSGTYYAITARYSGSRREIARSGDRICMKMVDGTGSPDSPAKVLISSLTVRADGFYLDATQEKLKLDATHSEFTDRQSVWQLLENKVDRSGMMAECLAAKQRYVNQAQGDS
jgi:hypothetical protein